MGPSNGPFGVTRRARAQHLAKTPDERSTTTGAPTRCPFSNPLLGPGRLAQLGHQGTTVGVTLSIDSYAAKATGWNVSMPERKWQVFWGRTRHQVICKMSMFFGIYRAFSLLRESGIVAQVVVRTRFDVRLLADMRLTRHGTHGLGLPHWWPSRVQLVLDWHKMGVIRSNGTESQLITLDKCARWYHSISAWPLARQASTHERPEHYVHSCNGLR